MRFGKPDSRACQKTVAESKRFHIEVSFQSVADKAITAHLTGDTGEKDASGAR